MKSYRYTENILEILQAYGKTHLRNPTCLRNNIYEILQVYRKYSLNTTGIRKTLLKSYIYINKTFMKSFKYAEKYS